MRLTTLASAAVLALSTAAIAQVGQAPEEQKLPANTVAPDDTAGSNSDGAMVNRTETPEPGAPSTALVNSAAGHVPQHEGEHPPK